MKIIRFIDSLEKYLIIIFMGVMIILACTQVLFRFVLKSPLPWTEECMRFVFVWACFVGAAAGVKKGVHVSVTAFVRLFPQRVQSLFSYFAFSMGILFCLLVIIFGFKVFHMQFTLGQQSAAMEMPMWIPYLGVPFGCFLMLIHFIEEVVAFKKSKV